MRRGGGREKEIWEKRRRRKKWKWKWKWKRRRAVVVEEARRRGEHQMMFRLVACRKKTGRHRGQRRD